jgi:hypothetical protein
VARRLYGVKSLGAKSNGKYMGLELLFVRGVGKTIVLLKLNGIAGHGTRTSDQAIIAGAEKFSSKQEISIPSPVLGFPIDTLQRKDSRFDYLFFLIALPVAFSLSSESL